MLKEGIKKMRKSVFAITGGIALIGLLGLSACGSYPIYKTSTQYLYPQKQIDSLPNKITKQSITIEDKGTAADIISPVTVQACNGNLLLTKTVTKRNSAGYKYDTQVPVFESVDPLSNVYVRRIKINNTTEHLLHLSQIDITLVDPAGNEHEMASKELLREYILGKRPCASTRAVVAALMPIKTIGGEAQEFAQNGTTNFLLLSPACKFRFRVSGGWSYMTSRLGLMKLER